MTGPRRGWGRVAMLAMLALLLLPVALLVLQNALINLALPSLLNQRPERLRIEYTAAWMLTPGHVVVRGLRVRGQGLTAQWLVTAEEASGTIALDELLERRFHARDLRLRGMSAWYRQRVDAEVADEVDAAESMAPPIPGLSNPPDPNPDLLYPVPAQRWSIRLDDVQAEAVDELWVGDYRLTGDMRLVAEISIADPYIDVDATATFDEVRATIGDIPVAEAIQGDVALLADSMDRRELGPSILGAISARAQLSAEVQDLGFLDFYLASVPWLSLTGEGYAEVDVALAEGRFLLGSRLNAEFPDLIVRMVNNEVTGSGIVRADVFQGADGEPESRLIVDFDNFAITPDGSTDTLVQGEGFHVDVQSPDTALDQPFSSVSVSVDLPESQIPNLAVYNAFLPAGIGLSLNQGYGTVRGHLVASGADSRASGELFFEGDEVMAWLDSLTILGDLSLHARLTDAQLNIGHYNLSGTTLELRDVGLINRTQADRRDGERLWSASFVIPSGVVNTGAPVYLDANLGMQCSDSAPFIAIFAEKRSLPPWAESLLSIQDVSGEARLQLGQTTLDLEPCTVWGGSNYEIALRYHRVGAASHGALFARAGPLSLGVALKPEGPDLKLIGARSWFDGHGEAAPSRRERR